MSTIASPIGPGDSGAGVRALQDTLLFLVDQKVFSVSARDRKGLAAEIGATPRVYGPFTTNAVSRFQRAEALAQTGSVDDATAAALNNQLEQSVTTGPDPSPGGGSETPPVSVGAAPRLTNSSRRIEKTTLVSIRLDTRTLDDNRGALLKFSFLRQLSLQQGEVASIDWTIDPSQVALFQSFEGAPLASQLPSPSQLVGIPLQALKQFGNAIVSRRRAIAGTQTPGVSAPSGRAGTLDSASLNLVNAGIVATKWLEASFAVTPIGMLNLERLEMTPIGIERGGLIATIPLAPLEETAVVHKEWSVTTKEFESIVTDSLENYSETGVTENTELAQATQSQTTHGNQWNVNGTVTGSYGTVTATVSSGFSAQDQNSDSASSSRKQAIATTRKASARVKQEHKTTISTTTVTGTSETSTRILKNPDPTNPIRIDYFSIMRKWDVGLYRYGLRLTYDIVIPEPGAALRQTYADIDELTGTLGPFTFNVSHGQITEASYLGLADQYAAQVPPYPPPLPDIYLNGTPPFTPNKGDVIIYNMPPLDVPDGYEIAQLFITYHFESHTGSDPGQFQVLGSAMPPTVAPQGDFGPFDLTAPANGRYLLGASGSCVVSVRLQNTTTSWVGLRAVVVPTQATRQAWQFQVWNALYNAAQSQYYQNQQDIQNNIAALQSKLNDVDTLTLRREENEEITKGVLRWLLGPSFDFMPADVRTMFKAQGLDTVHGTTFDSSTADGLQVLTAAGWAPVFLYEEMVKFINEAIEWENLIYFLYSYFWDIPDAWRFIRQIQHPDATRQAFLRAGSARVVLTVRKGWEAAWVNFVEAGGFGTTLLPQHPYLTIAQEIAAYDSTNYPGIPPANPAGGPLPDSGDSVATVSQANLSPSGGPVTIEVGSSAGFIVGYTAIIDQYSSGSTVGGAFVTSQETQSILAVPDTTHITVAGLINSHDGTLTPFPVMQAGEKGQLIAEWFEYTPTSGTDIAVTSNLASIS